MFNSLFIMSVVVFVLFKGWGYRIFMQFTNDYLNFINVCFKMKILYNLYLKKKLF